MRAPIAVTLRPARVVLFGRARVHHGLFGLLLLLHDARDYRVWLRDLLKHPQAR